MPTTRPTTTDAASAARGSAAAVTGLGAVLMALFPFSLPFLILTAAALAPLIVLSLIAAVPLALLAGVALAIRAGTRRLLGRRRGAERRSGGPKAAALEPLLPGAERAGLRRRGSGA
ncbi:MAG TPA: hypothetical protein VK919_09335 [Solirubrobacterales bacterium]|nr:hypothetical protein [Solirubrobacterales bacterium]